MTRHTPLLHGLAALLLLLSALACANGGSYASDVVAQSISTRNTVYSANFPLLGAPPTDGKITSVYYAWSFSYRPPDLLVFLCQGSTCLNVSKEPSGNTLAFRERNPALPFYLKYFVGGRGPLMPAVSGKQQLAVSYGF
ncbi:flagellar protein FlhE [Vogesella sp. LIG4]|uniref:flagellar protein FlhE n=1 Tax=Vogesella sp. LIG4 TaxID=1192162 RepID=UPI0008201383|nr:flagellar protein FlhE [Vogesella sp. LIG4]SCK12868.1 flagellar protein FlhE [Vogesella sp. LIG4]